MPPKTPPKWYLQYEADSMNHGPIPAGVSVGSGADGTPKYWITSDGKQRVFSRHPLTPDGRIEWGGLLKLAGEEKGSRADFVGVAHPPMVYKPSEWLCKTGGSLRATLVSALGISGVITSVNDLGTTENLAAVKELTSTHHELYHPCDRKKLAIFDKEHDFSCWTRHFKRGLIIVGPELDKNLNNWDAFRQAQPGRRSAVRARYSTGCQEEFRPVVLGCLPTARKTVKWFYLEPVEFAKPGIADLWEGCNWASQAPRFGYDDTEKFIWAAVLIQRSILLRAAPIGNDKLGDAIRQYGQYLAGTGGYGIKSFGYNTAAYSSSSPNVTFHKLTRWILASDENSTAKRHAKAWDKAISLVVLQRKSLTGEDWKNVLDALAAIQNGM
ncbi:hypothetical protein J4E91_000988 [Alternaria rosae]|nr:hypothetical protein J4E91_000988 [Alternaria rosae]